MHPYVAPRLLPPRRALIDWRGHPSHRVPRAGTLDQISYCTACGAAFDDKAPCAGVRASGAAEAG